MKKLKLKEAENLDVSRKFRLLFYVPEVIRTPDLPLRRRSLYPAELRKHFIVSKHRTQLIIYHVFYNFSTIFINLSHLFRSVVTFQTHARDKSK